MWLCTVNRVVRAIRADWERVRWAGGPVGLRETLRMNEEEEGLVGRTQGGCLLAAAHLCMLPN